MLLNGLLPLSKKIPRHKKLYLLGQDYWAVLLEEKNTQGEQEGVSGSHWVKILSQKHWVMATIKLLAIFFSHFDFVTRAF